MKKTRKIRKEVRILALPALAAAIFAACESRPEGTLEQYLAQRDSLRTERERIDAEIAAVSEKIALLDTAAERKQVTLYRPSRSVFKHYFEVHGNVQTDRAATLYAENAGLIREITVREGQKVKKGDVLVRLDAELTARNIAELRTSLELATTLYEKQKRLWEQNIGSEVQYLEAKNRKESLENNIATLREQKGKSIVRAPFDGTVDKIFPKEGEMATMQTPIARLVNLDNLYITADISERYMGGVSPGDKVEVIINRRDTLTAEVTRTGKYINPNNRSFEIRIDLETPPALLMPNSLVVLRVNDYTADDAIAIPSSLIMQDGAGKDYVFVAERRENFGLTARKQPITTGMRYLGSTLIIEGIEASVPIVDKGSRSVRDGDRVEEVTI